jgi:predicted transcriptional regulator
LSRYGYVLLTQEKWWNRRVAQSQAGMRTQSFVRKSVVGPVKTRILLFYVTHPARELRGIGDFELRVVGKLDNLWRNYGEETVFQSRDEFLGFMQARDKATFIRFRNLRQLARPVPLRELLKIVGPSRMPRSGKYLSKEIVDRLLRGAL